MKKKILGVLSSIGLGIYLIASFAGSKIEAEVHSGKSKQELIEEINSEFWMGIYMNEIKVGYSHNRQFSFLKNGQRYKKSYSESWMKVSRLGGNPVEIMTIQETLCNANGRLLETLMRTKMSESETIIKAVINPEKILFKIGDNIIKELAYEEEFYLEVPLERIIKEEGLKKGKQYDFKVLDPLSYSLGDCHFEVIGKEEVLILGKKMNLWHVKTETRYVIPIITDDWIDEKGRYWKSENRTSFTTTTFIRMSKEKALEISEENFDIAYSTIIKSNILFESPQQVKRATFKLSGISLGKIKNFPYDDGSQKILECRNGYTLIQTSSQIFYEKEAIPFPVKDEKFQRFLKPTSFCQSDDPEIKKAARGIVGQEKNSWRAAKKIADWIRREMTPNYDVGFASAKEILKNREGDCSEHTVLTVALCRALGIPARAAVGVMYAHGIFVYHMWPEVYVGRWIGLDSKWLAVDENSGEYYTDATHIKFGRSLLDENIFKEMAQAISEIIGQLRLEIIDYFLEKKRK